jgi:hydroxymethylpyrimidine/phosphomethylpyrimidine kinase
MKFAITIAASDPSGGAGIEADLKVFGAHKVFGLTAITALTVQGPGGLEKIVPTPVKDFKRILSVIAGQMPLHAVKIGALASKAHIRAVKDFLERVRVPVVLDPLLKASRGNFLLLKKDWPELFSLFHSATLITPNIPEAASLLGLEIRDRAGMLLALERFAGKGASAVLIKGGHLEGEPIDLLWRDGRVTVFRKRRVAGKFHGTGCALSSAIAAQLALGLNLEKAVAKSEQYVQECLRGAEKIGDRKYLTHLR